MHSDLSEFGTKRQKGSDRAHHMKHASLDAFLTQAGPLLRRGPVAMIFAEDAVELGSTLSHHLNCGFKTVLALMLDEFELPDDVADRVHRIPFDCTLPNAVSDAVNWVSAASPETWLYYCYNAEYLFFPFCETRTVGEMLTFHAQERRDAMLTYVVDLYAGDLQEHPDAVSLEQAYLDSSGYYALPRSKPGSDIPHERQLDFYGGLRWRYEEHVPASRRRIDRISLFRAARGLQLHPDHRFNIEEYNTYACPWHNNLTAAICSFRAAKALKRNPGSSFEIDSFRWHNSALFQWSSAQLMDLGLMEPGQWF